MLKSLRAAILLLALSCHVAAGDMPSPPAAPPPPQVVEEITPETTDGGDMLTPPLIELVLTLFTLI
jgi:hypothetical protein